MLSIGTSALVGLPFLAGLLWLAMRLGKIRRHLRLLDRAMDTVSTAVCITDARRPGHPVIAVNPAFSRLAGYDSRSLLGRPIHVLEGPETDLGAKRLLLGALRDGRTARLSMRFHGRDGRAFAADLRVTPVPDRLGRPAHSIWELRPSPVSEHGSAPAPARPLAPADLLEALDRAAVLVDGQGEILAVNAEAAGVFGSAAPAMAGQPLARYLPALESDPSGDAAHGARAPARDTIGLLHDGTRVRLRVTARDCPIQPQRARLYLVEDAAAARRAERRHAALGSAADLLATSTVLTQDCAAALLQVICQQLEWPLGSLWLVDAKANELRRFQTYRSRDAGLEALTGAPRQAMCRPWEGLVGRVWGKGEPEWVPNATQDLDWVPRATDPQSGGALAQPIRAGSEVIAVLEFLGVEDPRRDETVLPIVASLATLIGLAIRRSRVEEQATRWEAMLRKAQRGEALGTLAGGIAHDLNNALTTILGFAELALPALPSAGRTHRHLAHILTAGTRAKDLVQQILAFSRQAEHDFLPLRVPEVVEEALKLIRPSLPSTIEVRTSVQPDLPPVLGDPTQLRQVLVNLCANAEHAMRNTGGELTIAIEDLPVTPEVAQARPALRDKRYVRLSVRDTGCGMETRVHKRAFEPFFTTKTDGDGVGLGLAVVRGIVLQHNGAVYMESAPHQGTVVEIYLPSHEPVAPQPAGGEDAVPRGTERILYVEDELSLAELGREMLETLGYEVVVRTHPVEALRAFETAPQRFDAIISDQTMPQMTGERLAHHALRIRPDVPVLLLTGFSHALNAEKARAIGVRALLRKPLLLRDLACSLRDALDAAGGRPATPPSRDRQLDDLITLAHARETPDPCPPS